MIPATTILITIIISTSSLSVGEEEEKEFNFIKPNDDAGFFLPYRKLSMSGFDTGRVIENIIVTQPFFTILEQIVRKEDMKK